MEHIGVALDQLPYRDESEHGGRARHGRGKTCDMRIKPDDEQQYQRLDYPGAFEQIKRAQ